MTLHRRRGGDFTNCFESHGALNIIAEEKCDLNKCINLFENRNITNECMVENNIQDHCSVMSQDKENDQLFNKFDNVLFSLDSELNPIEASLTKQQIYRRLSEKYISSPRKFTEKLITILEESVINNTLNNSNNSIINFEKISKELQRMCNDLENESMPEQLLHTTMTFSPSKEISKIIMNNNPIQIKSEKRCSDVSSLSLHTDSCIIKTPSSSDKGKKVYRKTPRRVLKSEMREMDDVKPFSPSNYNNLSFEYLETQCERLFPNEKKDRASVQTIQDSTLLSMDNIYTICEEQLALLDTTDDIKIISEKKNESSVKELKKGCKSARYHPYPKSGSSICQDENINKKRKKIDDKTYKVNLDSEYIHCTDELDKTLLTEIVEKRRRCLDTAKKMLEINSERDMMEVQKKSKRDRKLTLDVNCNKPQDDNANFLNMLTSCKDYQNYLENHLPMLNISRSSKTLTMDIDINKSNKKNINTDLIPNNKKLSKNRETNSKSRHSKLYTENYSKILARWNVHSVNNGEETKNVVGTSNLFTTPAKISAKDKCMQGVGKSKFFATPAKISAKDKCMQRVGRSNFFTTPGKISTRDKRMQTVFFSDLHSLRMQKSSSKTPINRSKQSNSKNCNTTLTPARSHKRESLKSTLQVANNRLISKSVKSPLRKVSKLNVTRSPHTMSSKPSIRPNLLPLRKCSTTKNKENTII